MKSIATFCWSAFLLLSFSLATANAQTDKEVIIIEKTIDANGNEVSKKIIRKNGDDLSDEEVEDLLESQSAPFGQWDIESLGFGPDAFDGWNPWDGRNATEGPSIGLSLSFENGRATIVDVVMGSGAYDADIRANDELIAIEGSPIASFDDVKYVLDGKEDGEEVRVTIYRDGEEIEKIVALRSNNFSNLPFAMPESMRGQNLYFDFGGEDFGINLDSLFKSFERVDMDSLLREFGAKDFFAPRMNRSYYGEDNYRSTKDRASLGVFIDDQDGAVVVSDIIKESAADKAGIRSGDKIIRFDDQLLTSFRELSMLMNQVKIGDTVLITVERDGQKKVLEVTLD